jgi:CTP:molybdopterin cytidylyltransferase MocA
MSVAAIVLAAGASRRLGEPKQLIRLGPQTLLERTVRICGEAGCDPIIVVLGANAGLITAQTELLDTTVVINQQWEEGMASSIRAGVAALASGSGGCLLLTCDMPAVSQSHLRALAASGQLTASSYGDRKGVPAFFPSSAYDTLSGLHGDAGARELLRSAPAIELHGGELDIDTPENLERARSTLFQT